MNILSKSLLIGAAAVLATACSDDDNKGNVLDGTFSTIVTYEKSSDEGSSFTVTEPGTTKLTTFTSTKKFPTEGANSLLPDTRVLIYYKNESGKRYQSGSIDLRGVVKIFNGDAPLKPQSDISPLRTDMIDVQTAELSGTYVNVVAVAAVNTPSVFDVYIDEATVNEEYPRAYVVFATDSPNASQRMLYGSFDISEVWDKATCRGLELHYMTTAGKKTETFPKGSQSIKPMD